MYIKSIRFKTTFLYSGILLAILIAYNLVLFFSVRLSLIQDIDDELRVKAMEISNVLHAYEKIKITPSHPMSILEGMLQDQGVLPNRQVIIDELWRSEFETLRLHKDYINILSQSGRSLLHSHNVTEQVRATIARQFGYSADKNYFGRVRGRSLDLRVINLPFLYKHNLPLTIQVATPMERANLFSGRFMFISTVCILAIIILTSFLGSFFVKRILAPVVAVTKVADNISHMDLVARIPSQDTDAEMEQLIRSFNAMIERLEKSFKHINEFNSYVAHELKTPLAIVRGELELAVEQVPAEDENHKVLEDCLEEVDRMIKITKDLLLLTKLDYQPQILKFEKIEFKEFLREISEHTSMLATEKKIEISFDLPKEDLFVQGDRVHLRRLFLNIVVNAIKYTPAQGKIRLSADRDKHDGLRVDISDTGEGISRGDLTKIFDKFFRIDRGEGSHESGFGLGLSIALSIARAHQGDIQVRSKVKEGTTFTVILPLSV